MHLREPSEGAGRLRNDCWAGDFDFGNAEDMNLATTTALAQISPIRLKYQASTEMLESVIAVGRNQNPVSASSFPDYVESRKSLVARLQWGDLPSNVKIGLASVVDEIRQRQTFDIFNEPPELNFLRYASTDYFDWHVDVGGFGQRWRKMTFAMQLSHPNDYVGGDLELFTGVSVKVERTSGSVCAFPSFVPHRVAPISTGVRYVLVGWLYGPKLA